MNFASRVALFPEHSTNGYGDSTRRVLEQAGFSVVELPPLKSREVLLRRFQADVIIVSWLDNYLVSKRSGRVCVVGLLKLALAILLMRHVASTLVFVRHNSVPHHYNGIHAARLQGFIDWLERRFDHVVVHSPEQAIGGRRRFIGHPLYPSDSTSDLAAQPEPISRSCRLIMFGNIAPYKRILDVIAALPVDVELEVAGPIVDYEYLERVKRAAQDKNVLVTTGFIEDRKILERLRSSRGLLIAQVNSRSYVSGVLMFALSHRVPVYVLSDAYTEWVSKKLPKAGVFVFPTLPELLARASEDDDTGLSWGGVEELFGDHRLGPEWRKLLGYDI